MSPPKSDGEVPENGLVEETSAQSDASPPAAQSAEASPAQTAESSPARTFVEHSDVEDVAQAELESEEKVKDTEENAATPGEELQGNEAVEQELRELLGKMEDSYKDFSETVFKKSTSFFPASLSPVMTAFTPC